MVSELYLDYYLSNSSNHYLTYKLVSEERRERRRKEKRDKEGSEGGRTINRYI